MPDIGWGLRLSAAPLTPVSVGSVGPAAAGPVGAVGDSIGQKFVPTGTNKLVDQIKITFSGTPAAGTYRVCITDSLAIVLGYVDVVNPPTGALTVTLPSRVTMVVGTTYFVGVRRAGGNVDAAGYNFTTAVPVGGTSSEAVFGTNFASSNGGTWEFPFTLYQLV